MAPIFHPYLDILHLPVPSDVSQLVQELDRPLPNALKSASRESLSLCAISCQLLQSIPPELCSIEQKKFDCKILEVLDVTLLSSAAIRGQTQVSDEYGQRRTGPLWYTLLRTLGRVFFTGSSVLPDVDFVYPRDFEGEQGVASMLIGLAVDLSRDVPQSDCNSVKYGDGGTRFYEHNTRRHDETQSSEHFKFFADHKLDDATVLFGLRDTKGTFLAEEEEESDLPLEAHMLAGKEDRSSVLFPVICVADSDNIIPLISSATCHRHAWGLNMPVVGLQLSECDSLVQVHIAWTDTPPGQMPEIHILIPARITAPSLSTTVCQGTFDLANPYSTLQLVSFLLVLRPQFISFRRDLPADFPDEFLWRADTCYADELDARIMSWIQATNTATADEQGSVSTSGLSHGHSPFYVVDPTTTVHKLNSQPTHSKNASLRSRSNPVSFDQLSSSSSQAEASEYLTRLSCVKFAEQDGDATLNNPEATSISSWLTQRFAFNLTRVEPLRNVALPDGPDGYDVMLDLYNRMTSLQPLREWTCEDASERRVSTPVDQCFQHYHDTLFDELADTLSGEDIAHPITAMDSAHADIIKSRLSLLLKTLDGGFSREAQKTDPRKADFRRDWDALLETFYVSHSSEESSDAVLFDQTLRLQKNVLYEALSSSNESDAVQNLVLDLREVQEHADSVSTYYNTHMLKLGGATSRAHTFRLHCAQAPGNLAIHRITYLEEHSTLVNIVDVNFAEEPCTGTCDAILFTILPLEVGDYTIDMHRTYEDFLFSIARPMQISPSHHSRPIETRRLSVLLPQLLVEHSHSDKTVCAALNQNRMYCVSAVAYLAAIGITEYPVFGLVTVGNIGVIIMAWRSKEGQTYIMDRNARRFDLRKPLDAFRFASFLVRLRARDKQMTEAFKTHEEEFKRRLKEGALVDWSMPMTQDDDTNSLPTGEGPLLESSSLPQS